MKLNDLKPAPGSRKNRRRVGRGLGSGHGKTAGRGQKGQASRSGFSQGAGWEGGRSRLIMRLPKRGFVHHNTDYQIVNLDALNLFEAGATVNAQTLRDMGAVRHQDRPIKLLGNGEVTVQNLTVEVDAYSRSAVRALQNAGGTVVGDTATGSEDSSAASDPAASTPADSAQTQAEGPN